MKFADTHIPGVTLIDIEPIRDNRGYFARAWCREELSAQGIDVHVEQINFGVSDRRLTLRGMHLQRAPDAEAKLVYCPRGSAFDVAVDLRTDSPTYLQWFGVELSGENGRMLYVPEGCAHGYLTLADDTLLAYYTNRRYAPKSAGGVRWDDPAFGIDWPAMPAVVSEADANWPLLDENAG